MRKADLRSIHASLGRLLPPGALPRTPEEVVEIDRVREVVAHEIRTMAPALERGEKVFEWRVPRDRAPTLNEYAHMKGWQKSKRRTALDDELRKLLPSFPKALLHGARRRRWVRGTRFSTKMPDDCGSLDAIGLKLLLDSLVRLEVLADDSVEFLHREGLWRKTKLGNSHVLAEVYEMGIEGQGTVDEPLDVPVVQIVHEPGFFTKAIKESGGTT